MRALIWCSAQKAHFSRASRTSPRFRNVYAAVYGRVCECVCACVRVCVTEGPVRHDRLDRRRSRCQCKSANRKTLRRNLFIRVCACACDSISARIRMRCVCASVLALKIYRSNCDRCDAVRLVGGRALAMPGRLIADFLHGAGAPVRPTGRTGPDDWNALCAYTSDLM